MIQLYNVSKIYNTGVVALSNIDLHIPKGDFVFLVGPSGAGKSTFIKLIIGSELPTEGQVLVGGKNVSRLKPQEIPLLRRNAGVIFQDFKLLPDKTVYENISFALEVIEVSRKEIRRRVPAILELVGLRDKADMMPNQLSGGEQQRVSMARAIVNNPLVLLADEPTGNLDSDTSWGIMELLSEINHRGTTVIMATHNRDIVNRMKRRVVAIEKGGIIRDEREGAYGYAN
ncbi:MAG: cell division ATP-binding protein FtsE [Firmicutes bacterium]|nr:cell division ATP-binding protein FtsE [Bacillota bacterium]